MVHTERSKLISMHTGNEGGFRPCYSSWLPPPQSSSTAREHPHEAYAVRPTTMKYQQIAQKRRFPVAWNLLAGMGLKRILCSQKALLVRLWSSLYMSYSLSLRRCRECLWISIPGCRYRLPPIRGCTFRSYTLRYISQNYHPPWYQMQSRHGDIHRFME